MKFWETVSWVNNNNVSVNNAKVLNGDLEVALVSYSLTRNLEAGEFNIGYLSFISLQDLDYDNPRETKIFLKYDTASTKIKYYLNKLTKNYTESALIESEYERRLKFPLSIVQTQDSSEILHKAMVKEDIQKYFKDYKIEAPFVDETDNENYILEIPPMTLISFEFNNVFKIFNKNANKKKIRHIICPKNFGDIIPSHILFSLNIVFNDTIEYPLRYIAEKDKEKIYENLMYITTNIRYLRNIKIILKDPANQKIITSGSAVLHLEVK